MMVWLKIQEVEGQVDWFCLAFWFTCAICQKKCRAPWLDITVYFLMYKKRVLIALSYSDEGVRAKVSPRVFSLMVEDIHRGIGCIG